MKEIIGKVHAQFICVIDGPDSVCREIYVLKGGLLHVRINGHDGQERRFNMKPSDFENEFKFNLLNCEIGAAIAEAI